MECLIYALSIQLKVIKCTICNALELTDQEASYHYYCIWLPQQGCYTQQAN